MVYAHMRYSDKAFMGSVTKPERAADTVAMCELLFGAEFAADHTVCTSLINANSPLVWDSTMLGAPRLTRAPSIVESQTSGELALHEADADGVAGCEFGKPNSNSHISNRIRRALGLGHRARESFVGIAHMRIDHFEMPLVDGQIDRLGGFRRRGR